VLLEPVQPEPVIQELALQQLALRVWESAVQVWPMQTGLQCRPQMLTRSNRLVVLLARVPV
jgi:hypothetical protein